MKEFCKVVRATSGRRDGVCKYSKPNCAFLKLQIHWLGQQKHRKRLSTSLEVPQFFNF